MIKKLKDKSGWSDLPKKTRESMKTNMLFYGIGVVTGMLIITYLKEIF